jgi:hypothetical protein
VDEGHCPQPDVALGSLLSERTPRRGLVDVWRSRYFVEIERSIGQVPPDRKHSIATWATQRLSKGHRGRSLPLHKRGDNVGMFHDALDPVAMFEPAVNEFGYSLNRLTPSAGSMRVRARYDEKAI